MKSLSALVASLICICCSTRASGPGVAPTASACECKSAPSVESSNAPDPLAPVLAPGSDRPRAMRSTVLAGLSRVTSVTAFRSPGREHEHGTILLGIPPASVVEVDLATGKVGATHALPASGAFIRVAATDAGVVAVVGEPNEDSDKEVAWVFDDSFTLKSTLKIDGWASNVHADGKLAVVAHALHGQPAGELTVLALPTGTVIGKRKVQGSFADEWVPSSQVLLHGDRVYALTRGAAHYVLSSYSSDLSHGLAEAKMPGTKLLTTPPCGSPGPHYGDGVLAVATGGVLVVREGSIDAHDWDLRPLLPVKAGISQSSDVPAVDRATERVLLPTGEGAKSLGAERTEPVVVFRRDIWKWSEDGEVALRYEEPVRALFVAGRGVIVTQHPDVRVTVLEWGS